VYPARLVFISFLHSQHAKGQMVEPLRAAGYDVVQFKLDRVCAPLAQRANIVQSRPDLTKLNNLIGQLSTDCTDFDTQVSRDEELLRARGLTGAFDKLKIVQH
jgi:hypothetical protein